MMWKQRQLNVNPTTTNLVPKAVYAYKLAFLVIYFNFTRQKNEIFKI